MTSVGSGAGLTGGPITISGALSISTGGVTNAMLANPSLTVTAGTDLSGGGTVALGSSVTLKLDTTKVPQLSGGNNFTGNQGFQGNGNSAVIGDMGCGPGFVGLSLFPGSLACTTFAVMGDTAGNLTVNRPSGGSMYFRENDVNEMAINSGGQVVALGNVSAASFTSVCIGSPAVWSSSTLRKFASRAADISISFLRPPPFFGHDSCPDRLSLPIPLVPGGWSWDRTAARWRCTRPLHDPAL